MLEPTERDIVIRVLRDNFFAIGNPGASLQVAIGYALAAQITFGPNAQSTTENAVTFCENQPWRGQSDHPLIDLLKTVSAVDQGILVIIKRLQAIPLPPNPLQAEVLDGGIVFLGRPDLRQLVPALVQPAGGCVLRINGNSKWGKSYTFRFLKFLNLQRQPLIPIQLENPGPTTRAEDVADTLVQRMARAPENKPKIAGETPLRIGQLLADWVLNIALRTPPTNWWFVLDGFDNEALPDDTKEFIRQLALQIANGLGRSTIRLILINYRAELPRALRRLQEEEDVPYGKKVWIDLVADYYDRLALKLPEARRPSAVKARDQALAELENVPADQMDDKFMETLSDVIEDDTDELTA